MNISGIEKNIRFSIESRFEHVGFIGISVKSLSAYIGFDEIGASEVELAVVEAVNNAIEHAYQEKPGFTVDVELSVSKDRLVIAVCDTGRTLVKMPEPMKDPNTLSLNELPESGMGVFIIRSIMDDLSYETINGRNRFIMTKMLPNSL